MLASNQSELDRLLASARGGETIYVAPGSYSLTVQNRVFTDNVTIVSADPTKPAHFSAVKLTSVTNITLEDLDIGRAAPAGATESTFMVKATGSNITLDGNYIHGSLDNNASNDGIGIKASGFNITVENNEFEQLGRAGQFGDIDGLVIKSNSVHDMRSDGFDFNEIRNALIEGNEFYNFHRTSTDHPDAIQFYTAGTDEATTDVVIRDNVIRASNGVGMQGIFLANEIDLPYQRITIENNFILGTNMANGIYVSDADGVLIKDNTVISPTDDANPVWISLKNVTDLHRSGNIADSGGQKTPEQVFSSSQLALLKTANLASLTPGDFLVSGYGYSPDEDTTACFVSGTIISTPDGGRSIESLSMGDLVITHEGDVAPILWVGRNAVSLASADSHQLYPIRIRAGALGRNLPVSDLLISPDHALYVEDCLIQAGALVNGTTITRETSIKGPFVYFHIELSNHALILANGLPAETFIDNVDRMAFDNWEDREGGLDACMMAELDFPRAKSLRQVPISIRERIERLAAQSNVAAIYSPQPLHAREDLHLQDA